MQPPIPLNFAVPLVVIIRTCLFSLEASAIAEMRMALILQGTGRWMIRSAILRMSHARQTPSIVVVFGVKPFTRSIEGFKQT
jgi:hypothetical protein